MADCDVVPLPNGHTETVEELASELADEPPHAKTEPSSIPPVETISPDKIKAMEVIAPVLDGIEGGPTNRDGDDPDDLIWSHDPEHVSVTSLTSLIA